MTEGGTKRKVYTIRFPPGQKDVLEEMAKEAGVTKSELIRQALKLYQVVIEAKRKGKRIILENEKTGEREWLIV